MDSYQAPLEPLLITHRIVRGNTNFVVTLGETSARPGFRFTIHHRMIDVEPTSGKQDIDWRTVLTPYEKLNVMDHILGIYRNNSRDKDGMKIASAAITPDGHAYINVNGSITSSRMRRQCAEQKMTSYAEDEETDRRDAQGLPQEDLEYTDIYIKGGRHDVHAMGPCGDCTDLLSKVMKPEARVWILPAQSRKQVDITAHVRSVDELPEGRAWATTIGYLNRNRQIIIPKHHQAQFAESIAAAKKDVRSWGIRDFPRDAHRYIHEYGSLCTPEGKPGTRISPLHVPLDGLNKYMHHMLISTLADRVQALADKHELGDIRRLSDATIGQLIDDGVDWVRCSVIQTDDGQLYGAATVKGTDEKTSSSAENNAWVQAMPVLGRQGIRNVWCQEFNPRSAEQNIMRTSPKEAVERMLKRASKRTNTVDFHYIPFNAATLDAHEVAKIMIHRDARAIYPSAHLGTPAELTEKLAAHELAARAAQGTLDLTPPGKPR